MPSKFSKFLANILDDVAVLFATMAGVLLTLLPAIVFYLALQRQIIEGMVAGAVKS